MSKHWSNIRTVVYLVALSMLIGVGFIMAGIAISAVLSDSPVLLDFNRYGEGLFEAILIPIATIISLIAIASVRRNPWNSEKH